MKINSLYVCVKDMKRAVSFYEKFFNEKLDDFNEQFSIFDIHGFSFGLFNPEKADEKYVLGNNIVPNINVENVDVVYDRIKKMGIKIALKMTTFNEYKCFQFEDSEGNVIEVYQKGARPE
jgi:predicted enzyme related to lactoylglutathione lyase